MADPVLLIVDVQQDYFPGGRMPLPDMPAAAVQIARLLAHFRALRKPVVHIRHLATAPDAGFFEADTPGAEFHPSVTPQTEEPCILKHFPNAFRDTDLLTTLERLSARRLVICGAMSNEVGHFEAKCLFMPEGAADPLWPEGHPTPPSTWSRPIRSAATSSTTPSCASSAP
jgi:nicotinamidase-related amidase